jgi:hypothetical protein
MTADEHSTLLDVLLIISGKFILSGYRSNLYDAHALTGAWHRVDIDIDSKASSAKKKETKTECLWMRQPLCLNAAASSLLCDPNARFHVR